MSDLMRVVGVAFVWLCSSAVGGCASTAAAQEPASDLVDIGGHLRHLDCAGPADVRPTVVMLAGGGSDSTIWSSVRELLPPDVRSCAYDRAGFGRSEAGPWPRTMRQEMFELNAVLEEAGVEGPYVLVGHSMGGFEARIYAATYGDVAGIVLVDAPDENFQAFNLGLNRWVRVRELATGRAIPEPSLDAAAAGADEDYFGEELQQLYDARRADPQPLGDTPLIILDASSRPPGVSDEFWAELSAEGIAAADDLATLSRNAKLVRDPTSGHHIHTDNPALVVQSIEEAIAAVRTGGRLAP